MNINEATVECDVCGGTDFYKEAGNFYCNECQTQSQQIQEHVFDQGESVNKKTTKKIHDKKSEKSEDKLTSWECYNVILKGLTEELIAVGAKPELKSVVKCLWMKYLHKCEVFEINCDKLPKVSILGSKKDVAILYNVKKRQRRRSSASSVSSGLSVRRQRAKKRKALVEAQYQELSQSQSLTQDTSMTGETLTSLKSGSEKSDSSGKIEYNRYSKAELNRMMSKTHQKKHKHDVAGELSCHTFRTKDFPPKFARGPAVLTLATLYSILYIGLVIINDPLQVGDFLRYIREGHISFGNVRHFFDEDVLDRALNLPKTSEKLFVSDIFRKKSAKIAQFLDVAQFVKKPDLVELAQRYCNELNLPESVFECVKKLIAKTGPKMAFTMGSKSIPNYEGRVLSFIIFTLKLLFGLDGITESKFSDYSSLLDTSKIAPKMFNFNRWLKHVGYRDVVVRKHHLPSALAKCDKVDSDAYLGYLESQEIDLRGGGRKQQNEVKDYLQVLERVVEGEKGKLRGSGLKFDRSLTPFRSYAEVILRDGDIWCSEVMSESFFDNSLNFLLKPNKYLDLVRNKTVINGGANENIVTEDPMYLNTETRYQRDKNKKTVAVQISAKPGDKFVTEYLDQDKKASLKTTDVNVLLSNWRQSHKTRFSRNKDRVKTDSLQCNVDLRHLFCDETYEIHFQPFERYWLYVPANPVIHYFSRKDMHKILDRLPLSFGLVLRECSRIGEQSLRDFYAEFLLTEICLVYFRKVSPKGAPGNQGRDVEFKRVLKSCFKVW